MSEAVFVQSFSLFLFTRGPPSPRPPPPTFAVLGDEALFMALITMLGDWGR